MASEGTQQRSVKKANLLFAWVGFFVLLGSFFFFLLKVNVTEVWFIGGNTFTLSAEEVLSLASFLELN